MGGEHIQAESKRRRKQRRSGPTRINTVGVGLYPWEWVRARERSPETDGE